MSAVYPGSPTTRVRFSLEKTEQPNHAHCPLCIDSVVHPEEDTRSPAIIFLSMDGVMTKDRLSSKSSNRIDETIAKLFPHVRSSEINDYHKTAALGRHLNSKALDNLHDLIERIEKAGKRALVVLSSSWRNNATLQQHREEVFAQHLFCKYLCGKAAPENKAESYTPECKQGVDFQQRAEEIFRFNLEEKANVIEFWLRDHGFALDSTDFVVFDADGCSGLQGFGKHFIRISKLIRKNHVEQAAEVLGISMPVKTEPSYPGTGGRFECIQNTWDEPFNSGWDLCRAMQFKSITPDSLCKQFDLLGYSNGEIRIGVNFQDLGHAKDLRRYLVESGCEGEDPLDPSDGRLCMTDQLQAMFSVIANNNAFPPELFEKMRSIVERGKCDPCNPPPREGLFVY